MNEQTEWKYAYNPQLQQEYNVQNHLQQNMLAQQGALAQQNQLYQQVEYKLYILPDQLRQTLLEITLAGTKPEEKIDYMQITRDICGGF